MAIRLRGFRGEIPRLARELLPDNAAAETRNVRLTSGDLEPYNGPSDTDVVLPTNPAPEDIKTMVPFYDDGNTSGVPDRWLFSDEERSVVRGFQGGEDQRFILTRDDADEAPKISDRKLWFEGVGGVSYRLGLPLPGRDLPGLEEVLNGAPLDGSNQDERVVRAITDISELSPTMVSRDASNTAELTFAADHGLRTGDVVSVYNFGTNELDRNDISPVPTEANYKELVSNYSLNGTNVAIVAPTPRTIRYPSFGDEFDTIAIRLSSQQGKLFENTSDYPAVELAGNPQVRTYVYTWVSPFGGESVPSKPSVDFIVKEGQTVTLGNLPDGPPRDTEYYIRGIRLYRLVNSPDGSEYFRLKTLWFPNHVMRIRNNYPGAPQTPHTGQYEYFEIETQHPHMLVVDDKFFLHGRQSQFPLTTDYANDNDANRARFDPHYLTVTSVVDRYKFVALISTGGDVFTQNVDVRPVSSALTVHYDAGEGGYEFPDGGLQRPPRSFYTNGFVDDFRVSGLTDILESEDYDPPPDNLKGVALAHNGMLVGFYDNVVCFSEPDNPNAWPERHRLTLESDIVALVPVSGTLLALTVDYPYRVIGQTPESMAFTKIDQHFPCVSSRSVVEIKGGVMWATPHGIVLYSPSRGMLLVTERLFDAELWSRSFDVSSITAVLYQEKYLASYRVPGGGIASFVLDSDFTDLDNVNFSRLSLWFKAAAVGRDAGLYYISNRDYAFADGSVADDWKVRVFDSSGVAAPYKWFSKVFVMDKPMALGAAKLEAEEYAETHFEPIFYFGILTPELKRRFARGSTPDAADFQAALDSRLVSAAGRFTGINAHLYVYRHPNWIRERSMGAEGVGFTWSHVAIPSDIPLDNFFFATNVVDMISPSWSYSWFTLLNATEPDPARFSGQETSGSFTMTRFNHPIGNQQNPSASVFYLDEHNGQRLAVIVGGENFPDTHNGRQALSRSNFVIMSPFGHYSVRRALINSFIGHTDICIRPNYFGEGFQEFPPRFQNIPSDRPFRLPWGTKTDTYQVCIESDTRVRSVVLAENPRALERY